MLKDLRPLNIMLEILIIIGKISSKYLQPFIKQLPPINQYGERKSRIQTQPKLILFIWQRKEEFSPSWI